jgi:hypothetical protein
MTLKQIIIILPLFSSYYSCAQQIDIPSGIVYKPTSSESNNEAIKILKKEFTQPSYSLYDKLVYCGPILWSTLKYTPELAAIPGGNITINIPKYDQNGKEISTTPFDGKLIQNKEDFKKIWDELIKSFKNGDFTIRKLKKEELLYYWSVIPYDIEEPIFVIENSKFRIIVDLTKALKVQWIDQV